MKAIETIYNGYRFRSRLEARWAVFFASLGIEYEYESEGFELDDGTHYLPDFKLKRTLIQHLDSSIIEYTQWCEIKDKNVLNNKKFETFKKNIGQIDKPLQDDAVMLSGDPLHAILNNAVPCPRCGLMTKLGNIDVRELNIYCFPCDAETPSSSGNDYERSKIFNINVLPYKGNLILDSLELKRYVEAIKKAGILARSARFEFDENKKGLVVS